MKRLKCCSRWNMEICIISMSVVSLKKHLYFNVNTQKKMKKWKYLNLLCQSFVNKLSYIKLPCYFSLINLYLCGIYVYLCYYTHIKNSHYYLTWIGFKRHDNTVEDIWRRSSFAGGRKHQFNLRLLFASIFEILENVTIACIPIHFKSGYNCT
jgi:hypothetical protein